MCWGAPAGASLVLQLLSPTGLLDSCLLGRSLPRASSARSSGHGERLLGEEGELVGACRRVVRNATVMKTCCSQRDQRLRLRASTGMAPQSGKWQSGPIRGGAMIAYGIEPIPGSARHGAQRRSEPGARRSDAASARCARRGRDLVVEHRGCTAAAGLGPLGAACAVELTAACGLRPASCVRAACGAKLAPTDRQTTRCKIANSDPSKRRGIPGETACWHVCHSERW